MVVSRLDLQQLSGHHAKIMAEHDTDFKIIEIFSLPYWRGIFKNNLFHRDPLYGALCEKNKHRFMQNIFERVFCLYCSSFRDRSEETFRYLNGFFRDSLFEQFKDDGHDFEGHIIFFADKSGNGCRADGIFACSDLLG